MNHELPDVQAGFRKGRGTTDQIATPTGSSKKQESSRKTSISALYAKAFDCVDHKKLENSERDGTTWPASWETYMQVRKQQLELDMEQQTGSK